MSREKVLAAPLDGDLGPFARPGRRLPGALGGRIEADPESVERAREPPPGPRERPEVAVERSRQHLLAAHPASVNEYGGHGPVQRMLSARCSRWSRPTTATKSSTAPRSTR